MKPEDVPQEIALKVLYFFNTIETSEEIAEIIEIPGKKDIGLKIAQNILEKRELIGNFTDLKQLDDIPYIGPKRFAIIVNNIKNNDIKMLKMEKENIHDKDIPLMKFETNASAPVLRYDIPSPSSYEGKNYIELKGLKLKEKMLPYNSKARDEPTPGDFIESNREKIYEYLKDITSTELEKDFYLVFDLDDLQNPERIDQYVGTFTFVNDENGLIPEGWKDVSQGAGYIEVSEEWNGHSKVLKLYGATGIDDGQAENEFDNPQSYGIIEFWWGTPKNALSRCFLFNENNKIGIYLAIYQGKLQIKDASGFSTISDFAIANNVWYHVKLIFNCKKGTYEVYINNSRKAASVKFHTPSSSLSRIRFNCDGSSGGRENYLDAISYSWDPDYKVGRNFRSTSMTILPQDMMENVAKSLDKIDTNKVNMIEELLHETPFTLKSKYKIFKFFIQLAINVFERFPVFYLTMGGSLKLKFQKVPRIPKPRLIFIENYKLTTFPGDYGAGTTIKTFSLLPKEETEISIKTWKKSIKTTNEASSILDSYTEDKADEFESSIQNENSNTTRAEEASSYHAEASAGVSWGAASVNASVGAEGSTNSAREEFSKNVMNATDKHSQTASAKREVNVETSFESTEETGEEVTIMRRIENLNASRTLNFTFRQMNQQYHSLLHLTDVRIAFYNGFPGSMKQFALYELDDLVKQFLSEEEVIIENPDDLSNSVGITSTTPIKDEFNVENELRKFIMAEYGNVIDFQGKSRIFVEEVSLTNSNNIVSKYIRIIPPSNNIKIIDGKEVKEKIGQSDYIMRYEIIQNGQIVQPEDKRWIDGIILGRRVLTMKTDGIIVEALLGQGNALDNFSIEARTEKIRQEKFENDLNYMNIKKIETGIKIIEMLIEKQELGKAIESYKDIFGPQEGVKLIKDLFDRPRLDLNKA
jgi:hypothetical protein